MRRAGLKGSKGTAEKLPLLLAQGLQARPHRYNKKIRIKGTVKGQLSSFLCSCPKGYKLGHTGNMRGAGLKRQLSSFLCSCPQGYKLGPTGHR
jgi:hypothetical protein